MKKKNVMTWT